MTLRAKLSIAYGAIFLGVVLVAVLSFVLRRANADYEAFQDRRYQTTRLADELRQSSDDLTRLARTYVVTGDAKYERMYFDVLDIRNGRKPRPERYDRVYWDLVLNYGDKPTPDTAQRIPLQELLRRAGVTEREFAKLAEAQRNSDGLVRTELIAMNMVKGLYDDGTGHFTRHAAPDPEGARRLMHDEAYHRYKVAIMGPIGEFQALLADRTGQEVMQSLKWRNGIFFAVQATLVLLAMLTAVLVHLKTQQHGLEALVAQRTAALGQKIAELERVERALTDRDRQLQTIANNVPAIVSYVNAQDLRFRFVNRVFGETFGISPENARGKQASEVLGDWGYARALPYIDRARAGEQVSYDTVIPVNGVDRWYNVTYVPEFDEHGAVLNITVLAVDVTERKQSEDALREQEANFRNLAESTRYGIVIAAGDGCYPYANGRAAELLRCTADELRLTTLRSLADPADFDRLQQNLADRIAGRPVPTFYETTIRRPDGTVFPAEVTGARTVWKGQVCDLVSFHDITDRRRAEEERRLLQDQLAQAQRMELVGRLAGGVAHDFNNMLGVILGHTELAVARLDTDAPVQTDLEEIRKAAQRSADLTRQLLAFARKQTIAPKVLDLNEIIEGTLKMLRRLIGEDILLSWKPAASLWRVKVDPSQVDQILANLAVNARDAIAGVGTITIETANVVCDEVYCADRPGAVPGSYVRLAVTDTGCGMDADTQAHLFEPFFTTKVLGKGTGLGLATVYGSVKQNNGFVDLESEPGRGTIFRIHLPRYVGARGQSSEADAVTAPQGGSETILLVEDEPAILKMGETMLDSLGYHLLTANSPGEAIRLAGKHAGEIHLLITDVVMPEMNGRDLARRLVALRPSLGCLFMSGYTSDIIADHGVVDEGVCFIQKPFSMTVLATKIREALGGLTHDVSPRP